MGLFHSAHLNLTEAQQTALQTLQSEFQSAQPKPEAPDEATRTAQQETFKQVFKHSPLKRTKFAGIQRNLKFIQQ